MKIPYQYWVPGIILICVIVALIYAPFDVDKVYFRLQGPLFTGFLTVGGFLLTLKTFILVKLKEGIYGTEFYKKRFFDQQNLQPNLNLYRPLQQLSNLLIYSVLTSLSTSACQLILGSLDLHWANIVCLSVASMTLSLVFFCWWEIKANLSLWFQILDEEAKSLKSP